MTLAPIALFVHRRPEHVRRTLSALAADPLARHSSLTIFSDGAKSPEHQEGVRAVRDLLYGLEGFGSIEVVMREENLGLARSIVDGVTRLTREHGRAIVVEDDLIVSPGFLGFLNRGLDVYADADNVYQVSGYMFPGDYGDDADALFLPLPTSWGWATWDRAWQHNDPTLAAYSRISHDESLKARLTLDGAYDYFRMATQQKNGEIDSWAICWYVSVLLRNGLILYPQRTLVQNCGFDGSGTHGAGNEGMHSDLWKPTSPFETLRLPSRIETDLKGLAQLKQFLRGLQPSLAARLSYRIRREVKRWVGQ